MQTTVKHTKGVVAYLALGERAVEIRLFPWKFQVHRKRLAYARVQTKVGEGPTLPGFTEPEHPPQTNTVVGS